MAGFEDYESFASTHQKWVHTALEEIDTKQECWWTGSLAVGGSAFIEGIKNAMGAIAKGRSVQPTEGELELRKAQSAYNTILGPKNYDIDPQ